MDPNFGLFITKEYGLLKQILSYLKPLDLHNARSVCREWRNAVDNLVNKNPQIMSYKLGAKDPMPYTTEPMLPDLVIYQNVMSKEFTKPPCPSCKQSFIVCCCEVTGPKTAVISLYNTWITAPFSSELYLFWQIPTVLVFSSSENMKVSTYYYCKEKKALIKFMSQNQGSLTDENEPVKGILIVSKRDMRKVAEKLLNDVVDKQGPTFAVGGGLDDVLFCKKEKKKFTRRSHEGLRTAYVESGIFITFAGNGVSAHSELITGQDEASIEKSMAELKQRAGEVPKGGTRVAFIAQCVDRRSDDLEKLEYGLFRKYFPNVPQCGFRAWGEFGIKSGSSDEPSPKNKSKRKKLGFFHSYTTSILIVTTRKI